MNNDTRQCSQSLTRRPMDEETARAERRKFLKRAGRFAVYTPPAIMLLMNPSRDAVAGSALGKNGGGTTTGSDKSADDVLQAILNRFNGASY